MTEAGASDPVCARHPDRVTYVLCNRCGRGICTDCMIPAPVGFHCPDCVREARASTPRRVRRVADTTPTVTYGIVILCVIIQVLGDLGIGTSTGWVQELSVFPARIAAFGETYRLITAIFVHSGWLHLGMNMLVLWIMGRSVEQAFGHVRTAALFLIAGFGGAVASYWFNDPFVAGVGASGAIFGMFAAIFMVGRELRVNTQEIVGVIALNLVIGFVIPGVDWRAHLGGLVTGAIVGWALIPHRHRVLQVLVPVLVVAGLVLATQWRTDVLLPQLAAQLVVHS